MLRGPQTPGELKQRSERMHSFESLAQVAETLDLLAERELAARLDRQPGQKEVRYVQLLGGAEPEAPVAPADGQDRIGTLEERLSRLERAFDELTARLPDRE
jgi:uncharacterized protein